MDVSRAGESHRQLRVDGGRQSYLAAGSTFKLRTSSASRGFFFVSPEGSMPKTPTYDLIIIGAGPAGLSCALAAEKAGLSYVILEKGSLADAIRRFPVNMTFFSTPELLEIGGIPFLTAAFRPTRVEAVRYYQRAAAQYGVRVRSDERVDAVRKDDDVFEVRTSKDRHLGRAVVVATGYFDRPAPYEVPGSDLPKVLRYFDEGIHYFERRVAVVGGKNSAVETALELHRAGADVTLIHRGPDLSDGVKYWILPDIQNRIKSGDIRALFNARVVEVKPDVLVIDQRQRVEIPNDCLFVMIGYDPDVSLLSDAGAEIDRETHAPVHNPNTLETTVKGLYVAGSIAAGRLNNKIFIENGRLHGELIVRSFTSR